MAEFVWHRMADEEPPESVKDYLVMGHNGGLIVANLYGPSRFAGCKVFARCGHETTHIPSSEVYAWAEIPTLEDDGESPYDANYRIVRDGRCSECLGSYEHNGGYRCHYLDAEIIGGETDKDGFCYRFEPRDRQEDDER